MSLLRCVLNIQVFDAFGMGLDEGFAGGYFVSHQGVEYVVGLDSIIYVYRKQGTGIWIHGGFP